VLVALVPALRASKTDVGQELKDSARTTGDRRSLRLRNVLVISEVALATVLLISAGLLIESFRQLSEVDAGFRTSGVATLRISLPRAHYADAPRIAAFYRDLLQRVESAPAVRYAGLVNRLPLSGQGSSGQLTIERPDGSVAPVRDIGWRAVSSHYFRAMSIPLLRGREFAENDVAGQPGVVIIDDLVARTFWPNADPIGQRVKLALPEWDAPWLTVVGIVRHIRHAGLDSEPQMQVYWPFSQRPEPSMVLVAQTAGDPQTLLSALRSQVLAVDRSQPVSTMATMDSVLADSLASRRFTTLLLGVFAVLALALAALGIYGLMAYIVSLRTREIGVRMALGASRANVLGGVMREVLMLTVAGLLVGLGCTAFTRRLLVRLLYGVSPSDPTVWGLVTMLLLAVAIAGGIVPALRAAGTSAMVALRSE
jgi:predicted permease